MRLSAAAGTMAWIAVRSASISTIPLPMRTPTLAQPSLVNHLRKGEDGRTLGLRGNEVMELYYKPYSPFEYLMHFGIKGQKWGVKRGPPYPLGCDKKKKVTKSGECVKLSQDILTEAIRTREVSLKLNLGHQKKHLPGRADKGRSYILGDLATAQQLVLELSGTGELTPDGKGNWTHQERVTASEPIGVYVFDDGTEVRTDKLLITYGKKGTHIYAAQVKKP